MPSRSIGLFCLLAVALFGRRRARLAYLDPGTGSMILQVLLGGVAGVALAGRSTGAGSW